MILVKSFRLEGHFLWSFHTDDLGVSRQSVVNNLNSWLWCHPGPLSYPLSIQRTCLGGWICNSTNRANLVHSEGFPSWSPLSEQHSGPRPNAVTASPPLWQQQQTSQPGTLALGQLFLAVLRLSCGWDLSCPQVSPVSSAPMPAAGPHFSPFIASLSSSYLTGKQ